MMKPAALAAFLALALFAFPSAEAGADDRDDSFAAPKVGEGEMPQSKLGSDPRKAIVVAGIATTGADSHSETVTLRFRRYDPNTKEFVKAGLLGNSGEYFGITKRTRNPVLHYFGNKVDPTTISYEVEDVTPGEWILTEIVNSAPVGHKRIETTQLRNRSRDFVAANATGPHVTVDAGEVIYIGTFHIDVMGFPAKVTRFTREDAAAKEALAKSPDLQAKFAFRLPFNKKNP